MALSQQRQIQLERQLITQHLMCAADGKRKSQLCNTDSQIDKYLPASRLPDYWPQAYQTLRILKRASSTSTIGALKVLGTSKGVLEGGHWKRSGLAAGELVLSHKIFVPIYCQSLGRSPQYIVKGSELLKGERSKTVTLGVNFANYARWFMWPLAHFGETAGTFSG